MEGVGRDKGKAFVSTKSASNPPPYLTYKIRFPVERVKIPQCLLAPPLPGLRKLITKLFILFMWYIFHPEI